MAGINKVILVGNLGKDPEMRYLEGGAARANFTLATTEVFKDKNGNRAEHTEWHYVVMWRSLAETAEKILKKGAQVYIEGKLQTRVWQDKEGHKRNITEIVADHFLLLTKKEPHTSAEAPPPPPTPGKENTGEFKGGDDLPF